PHGVAGGNLRPLAGFHGLVVAPEVVIDGAQPRGRVVAAIAAHLGRPAVVGRIRGADQVVLATRVLVLAAANGVIDQVVLQDFGARGDVVVDLLRQALLVVGTPPDPAV